MPIRYTSGTYSTPLTLLTALDTYLVSTLGWTQNMAPTLIAGKSISYRAHYQKNITKNGETVTVYWNMATQGNASENIFTTTSWQTSSTNTIGLYGYCSTGYNAGSAWDGQAGLALALTSLKGMISCVNCPASGSGYAYNFYGNQFGDFYLTTQYTIPSNFRQYMTCGLLEKAGYGVWSGGTYYGASLNVSDAASLGIFGGQQTSYESIPGLATSNSAHCPTLMVYGTVDGVTGWITIPVNYGDQVVGGTPNYTTARTGQSGIGYGSALGPSTLPMYYTIALPGVYPYEGSIASPSGIIFGQQIELCVVRTSGRRSPIGIIPLIQFCQALYTYGLPWHYQAADASWQLENNLMISLVNA